MRIILISIILFSSLFAQDKIIVGTKVAEPFVIKQNGAWGGLSFDLWQKISSELGYEYEVREYDLEGLVTAVENEEIDIAVSPLTITAAREEKMDFTLPYLVTGLSIAVAVKEESGFLSLAKNLLSVEFISTVGVLIIILFLVGLLTWFFERKKNPEQFGDGKSKGLWSSFWFAAVTMTTVGYGDKAPKSIGGRVISLIWMFTAIIIISSITAAIASALTVGKLETKIKGLNDLYSTSVGTVPSSTAEDFLVDKRINYLSYDNVSKGLEAIATGDLDAFVYDAPIMKYLIKQNGLPVKVKVLPNELEQVYYGFALHEGSKLREPLNRRIIDIISNPSWEDLQYKYFGE